MGKLPLEHMEITQKVAELLGSACDLVADDGKATLEVSLRRPEAPLQAPLVLPLTCPLSQPPAPEHQLVTSSLLAWTAASLLLLWCLHCREAGATLQPKPLRWIRRLGSAAAGLVVVADTRFFCQRPTSWTTQAFEAGLSLHGAAVAEAVADVAARPAGSKLGAGAVLQHLVAAGSLVLALLGRCAASTGLLLGLLPEALSVCYSLALLASQRPSVVEPILAVVLLAHVLPSFLYWEATSLRLLALLSAAWLLRLPSFVAEVLPDPLLEKPQEPVLGATSQLELGLLRGGGSQQPADAQEPCRLIIRGAMYDVTSFLQEHPGGEPTLRRLAGQDATEAFMAVGHSEAAVQLMKSFEVLSTPSAAGGGSAPQEYDLTREPAGVWDSLRRLLASMGAVFLMLAMQTALADSDPRTMGQPSDSAPWAPALLGTALATAAAQVFFWMALPESWRDQVWHRPPLVPGFCQVVLVLGVHTTSFPVVAASAGMGFLIHSVRMEGPALPSAMGAVAWALLFQVNVPWTSFVAGDGCMMGVLGGSMPAAAVVLLSALAFQGLVQRRRGAGRSGLAGICAAVMAVQRTAGVTAACLWLLLKQLQVGAADTSLEAAAGALRCGASTLLLGLVQAAMADVAEEFGESFASGWLSATFGPVAALLGLRQDGRLALALFGWLLHLQRAAADLATRVTAASAGEGGKAAASDSSLRLLFLIDNFRSLVAMTVWSLLGRPLEGIVTWMLPGRLRVFAFEAPIDDLGGRLQAGVCLMLEGTRGLGAEQSPGHVVCNVGHLPTADDEDLRATVRSSLQIMEELSGTKAALRAQAPEVSVRPPANGFVANLLCVLPKPGRRGVVHPGWLSVREVNLSVWSNEEAAVSWYRQSEAHAAILAQHKEGKLRTFGNLLLTLNPTKVAWQRRCKACAAVVDGLGQSRCSCGAMTYDLPAF